MAGKVMDLNRFVANPNAPHKPIKISIKDADTITFSCDDSFYVKEIGLKASPAQRKNPFHRQVLPFVSTEGSDNLHRASSGPAMDGNTGHYKITFVSGKQTIDPDFIVDP
jgi:hypothetical protein